MAEAISNVALVQQGFADFGAGNLDALLERFEDNIVWETPFPPEIVPYSGRLEGKANVREFFEDLARTTEFAYFRPEEYVASGDKVVALGSYQATVRETGKSATSDFAMVFTIRDGKIAAFKEYADTQALIAAWSQDEGRIVEGTRTSLRRDLRSG
jgi:ketosteroid isomerase-like protein